MRRQGHSSVSLVVVFVIVLVAIAVAVCAGAAAPARAAFAPHGIWSSVLGPTINTERWVDVAKGPDGSLYAGGDFGYGALNGEDLMVAKFSADNGAASHRIWADTWDNPTEHRDDQTSAIAIDHTGAVVVVGSSDTASNGWEWVVAKWSASGARLWQQTFAASPLTDWNAYAWDVACDAAGHIYVCGTVQTGTHDSSVVASLVVRKLASSDGHILWTRAYAGNPNSFNQGSKLALDTAGNVYCTGYGQSLRGDSDIITCRFQTSNGRLSWVGRIGGAKHRDDEGAGVVVRGANVWVTGGEYTSASTRVVALAKYTLGGHRIWLRTWLERSGTTEHPYALAVDAHGDAVVVGAGNDNPVTREHAFIVRWNSVGRLRWRRISYNSVSHEATWRDVVCDAAGRIWVGGYEKAGSSDALLVARYSATGARVWKSSWKGPDGLGGECNALCIGKTGLFVGGSVITTIGGEDAAALKYVR